MIERFQRDNINVTLEKLQAGNPNSVITRAHFARVLMEEDYVRQKIKPLIDTLVLTVLTTFQEK